MGTERSAERDKAKEIYLQRNGDISLLDIATTLGVSDGTVRSWKNRDKWDLELSSEKQEEKAKTKTRGAPLGNKFTVGGRGGDGGPPRNKKTVKTHEYESFYFSDFDDDEKAFISNDKYFSDPLYQQRNLIKLYTLREKKIIGELRALRKSDNKLLVDSVKKDKKTQNTSTTYHGVNGDVVTDTATESEDSSHTVSDVSFRIAKFEDVLSRVSAQKQKAIEAFHRISMDLLTAAVSSTADEADPYDSLSVAELQKLAGGDYLDDSI